MTRITRLLSAVTVGVTLLVAQNASAENTLTWPTPFPYRDIDPAAAFGPETYFIGSVYETLTFYEDGEVLPRLATSWEKSDGGATWTVKLREGVKFHDGSDLNSAAVKKSFEYTRDQGMGAGYLYAGLEAVETPDSHTVIFKFDKPIAFDLVASGQYGSYVIGPAAIDKGHDWMQEGNAIGTGPYMVTKFEPGELLVLDRFDDYWGGWEAGQVDRIIQPTVMEASTRVQMIESGEADIGHNIPRIQLAALDALPNVDVAVSSGWRNHMFLLNTQKYPTDNVKFREALAHLWDHESVLDGVFQGYARAPVGPIPSTMWGHGVYEMPSYDPATALQLLEESGVPQEDWKVTALYSTASQEAVDAIELFQATAAQVGVEIELLPQQSGQTYLTKARSLDSAGNVQGMVWYPAYPTPSDWLYSQYRTEENPAWNLSYYANEEFDAALDSAIDAEGVDLQGSTADYIAAQDILMSDTPAIFYGDVDRVYAYSADIEGMEDSSNPAYETLFIYNLRMD